MGTRAITTPYDIDAQPVVRRRAPRRYWSRLLLFAASVVLVNGLFGERGLMDSVRARRTSALAARQLDLLKRENAALRAKASRLRSDPGTIEALARGELGLSRAGEILVTIKDITPPR
jgi:cell division protein FtsB